MGLGWGKLYVMIVRIVFVFFAVKIASQGTTSLNWGNTFLHVMYKLLYPSIRVRTAPPVSVRVRVRVSVSFSIQ